MSKKDIIIIIISICVAILCFILGFMTNIKLNINTNELDILPDTTYNKIKLDSILILKT